MTTILHKRGKGIPTADKFSAVGEILIDSETGIGYTLTDGGDVSALGGEVDLSDYVSKSEKNDVIEGQFRLVWDHSSDPDFPFNGSVGYDANNKDPDSPSGAFLYASGINGTVTIGRDGDMELHGKSEIKGIPDREGNLPWVKDFSYVQAADFLDADGNSIIGAGEIDTSNLVKTDKQNLVNHNFYLHNADWSFMVEEYQVNAPTIAGNSVVAVDSSFLPFKDGSLKYERHAFQVLRGDGSNPMYVTHDGVVQAQDYLDADGNSIIGAGDGDGDAISPLIVDATSLDNYEYRKAVVAGKVKYSNATPDQQYNLTFEAARIENYGFWYQSNPAKLYVEDIVGDNEEVQNHRGPDLGDSKHPFNHIHLTGDVYCKGVLHQYGQPVVDTPSTHYAIAYNATNNRWQECGTILLEPTYGDGSVPIHTLNNTTGPIQATDFLDADGNSIVNKQQVLTQSEYDALTPDPDTVYFIV